MIVINNVSLVPFDGKNEFIEKTNVYINEDKIYKIGELDEHLKVKRAINGKNKVLIPGLINAHTHLGMSIMKNFADDMGLHEWLNDKIWPLEAKMNGEDVYWASLLSMVEMIQTGTTALCDMYMFMDRVAEAVEQSGMRAVLTRGMIETQGDGLKKINESREFFNNWDGRADGRIKVMIAPHAPYTCGPEYLVKLKELSEELGCGIHIHLSETIREVEESINKYGKTPIKHVYDLGLFDRHTIAAHCVHVNSEDIALMKEKSVVPVNNPSSNLKLASGFAPVSQMMDAGLAVALGTDGSSSNNSLNMFKELHFAAMLNKAVTLNPKAVPAIRALEMATVNGAKALNQWDSIGSIEAGKKADLVLVDLDKPNLCPTNNIVSALAYSAQGSDVDTVIVDGKILMENREIKVLDVEKIMRMAKKRMSTLI